MQSCEKCGQPTWELILHGLLYAQCICGKLTPFEVRDGKIVRYRFDTPKEASIPKKGSKLHLTLSALAQTEPVTTAKLAEYLELTSDDTATQLTILFKRGFSTRKINKKGIRGGSLWTLTEFARNVLGLNKEVKYGTDNWSET